MQLKKLSTENLNLLPKPYELKNICKSIAALEAIICPDWQYRYYSYQKDWSETEEFCEMRNGQGDQMLILFSDNGTCINGFAHKSKMNGWKNVEKELKKSFLKKVLGSKTETKMDYIQDIPHGVVNDLPKVFSEFMFGEPVKSIGTTFCIWQVEEDVGWKIGEINLPKDDYKDGSMHLLKLLKGEPSTYKIRTEQYYEEEYEDRELKLEHVEKIFNRVHITKKLVREINPKLTNFDQLKSDLDEIGYENQL